MASNSLRSASGKKFSAGLCALSYEQAWLQPRNRRSSWHGLAPSLRRRWRRRERRIGEKAEKSNVSSQKNRDWFIVWSVLPEFKVRLHQIMAALFAGIDMLRKSGFCFIRKILRALELPAAP